MEINVTLFVQAIQFMVAYALLRFFVFKPFLQILNAKEEKAVLLEQNVLEEKQKYNDFLKEKQAIFVQLKNQLMQRMPSFEQSDIECASSQMKHFDVCCDLSEQQQKEIREKALKILRV